MDLDKIVCSCLGVSVGDIKSAVEDGASTYEEVQEKTGAATACGMCEDDVKRWIDEFKK